MVFNLHYDEYLLLNYSVFYEIRNDLLSEFIQCGAIAELAMNTQASLLFCHSEKETKSLNEISVLM